MPTNTNAYNSRVTDEALEKRFRDTFRSQGGAELVDDLYAQGVIVPVVDFTAAAEGVSLRSDLQVAWDFATTAYTVVNTTTAIASNAGFWKCDLTAGVSDLDDVTTTTMRIYIDSGLTTKNIWAWGPGSGGSAGAGMAFDGSFVVFLRSGDTLRAQSTGIPFNLHVWTRQIADISGNLVDPSGFTSS